MVTTNITGNPSTPITGHRHNADREVRNLPQGFSIGRSPTAIIDFKDEKRSILIQLSPNRPYESINTSTSVPTILLKPRYDRTNSPLPWRRDWESDLQENQGLQPALTEDYLHSDLNILEVQLPENPNALLLPFEF